MNITIWIIQAVLSFAFLMAGLIKISQSCEILKEKLGDWVDDFPLSKIRLIGLLEILGAIGLILPTVLNFFPVLTPIAAIGLALTMTVAFMTHLRRKEVKSAGVNVVLFLLTVFVVYGRWVIVPLF